MMYLCIFSFKRKLTFTTDFEKDLINGFNKVFNHGNKIHHISFYFRYLQNCRRKLVKEGYNPSDKKPNSMK